MALAERKIYTIDDIYNLPDGERAELIDGQLYMMAPPSRKHQEISQYLSMTIGNFIRSNKGECKVYPSPFAVFLNADDATYVEPDISVICDKDKLNDKGCVGAPDWIIEIVSPGSRRMDYYTKLYLYQTSGVKEYWIVDADRGIILVYHIAEDEAPVMYRFTDQIKSGILKDCEIDFSELSL